MRSVLQQAISLPQRFFDQAEFRVLEVAQPTVDDAGGGRTGAGTEIGFFHQQRIHSLKSQFAKQPDAIDATPDNQGRHLRLGGSRRQAAPFGSFWGLLRNYFVQ